MTNAPDVAFIFDTDALTQIFIAGQQNLLQLLQQDFGVRSFIMSEVDVELRSKPKFSGLIRPQLDKAVRNGWINLLTATHLDQLASLREESNPVTLGDIRELGANYSLDIERGEAYTHAAAILLEMPAVSNDMNAIKTLEARGKTLPQTILRSFDIFGFFYQESYLDEKAAEQIRTTLRSHMEWLPASMKNASFRDGFSQMKCRLSTSMAISGSGTSWASPFYLKRIQK